MTLPPHVQAEVQRILDRAARRLLAEQLAEPTPPRPADAEQKEEA